MKMVGYFQLQVHIIFSTAAVRILGGWVSILTALLGFSWYQCKVDEILNFYERILTARTRPIL